MLVCRGFVGGKCCSPGKRARMLVEFGACTRCTCAHVIDRQGVPTLNLFQITRACSVIGLGIFIRVKRLRVLIGVASPLIPKTSSWDREWARAQG